MASSSALVLLKNASILITLSLFFLQVDGVLGCYTSIFSFGDSLVDTGNFNYTNESKHSCMKPPFGVTYFHRPTGRCSDGRMIIDFIAQGLGLPFLPAYLRHTNVQDFKQGVTFGEAGATGIDVPFFTSIGLKAYSNHSLSVQIGWFKDMLPALCGSPSNCRNMLRSALFIVGEIGGNDYGDGLRAGRSLKVVRTFVPKVIKSISSAIQALVNMGAVTVMAPGNMPMGCLPAFLTTFENNNPDDFDPSTGCLNGVNELCEYHNYLLQIELKKLREINPHTTIMYGDLYNAASELFHFPEKLGFKNGALRGCCGGGGRYNYNDSARCGDEGSTVCDDITSYVQWDGYHYTENAFKWVATGLLGPYSTPHINPSCVSLKSHSFDHPYF
ncbi:hypothetical protein IFM89_029519 [Coptis chinensis]|uniref:GDSL esterase/lipase n=1 Tax=Coptis chinensis TaxID=261450 RepID=A0A835H3A7_9MAGN|nr:hypothetical protein IFM89_029519 [Coptis chinensis]